MMEKTAAAVAPESYTTWGTKIANDYLNQGTPLADGVRLVAQQQHLNPDQIRRTAEAANHATFAALLPQRAGGDVRFDAVKGQDVVNSFNQEPTTPPNLDDYHQLPAQKVAVDQLHAFPHRAIILEMEKQAEELREYAATAGSGYLTENNLRNLIDKLSVCLDEVRAEDAELARQQVMATSRLTEYIRQSILEKNATADEIFEAVIKIHPEHQATLADPFAHAFSKLAERGYIKIGGQTKIGMVVDPKLVSKGLKALSPGVDVVTVNGSHPIMLSVDTLIDLEGKRNKQEYMTEELARRIGKARNVLVDVLKSKKAT